MGGGWVRHVTGAGRLPACACLLVVAGVPASLGTLGGPASEDGKTRLVLSASASSTASLATPASTGSRVWKRYVASDDVCPGGDRTDVTLARRAATVVCLVNFAREQRGLKPLRVVSILNNASVRKARAILRCGVFAHNPCGGDWTVAVRSTGYGGQFGENLYLATGEFGAPRPTVEAWLNSKPHRQNLFRTSWRELGLAVVLLDQLGEVKDASLWVSVLGKSGS